MHLIVTPRDPERAGELAETIEALESVDSSLRKTFSGGDVDEVTAEAQRSFASAGVEMSDADVRAYAEAVVERRDFEYTLEQ